jgi:putative aldouronate transport system substrate-binding protein
MKKGFVIPMAACIAAFIAACDPPPTLPESTPSPSPTTSPTPTATPSLFTDSLEPDGRFATTRHITVEVFNRSNDGGSAPEDNAWTDWIKAGLLRDRNIDVSFVPVMRWSEVSLIDGMLASGGAPDLCYTYSPPTIQSHAAAGRVVDIAPYIDRYRSELENLFSLLGENNVYFDRVPSTGKLWNIEGLLKHNNRTGVFVREDWLEDLGLEAPTTLAEFETMLRAFKNNADALLGFDGSEMIPFSLGMDSGWRADLLATSFVPDGIADSDLWIRGYDDRRILLPGIKDGIKRLNAWYEEGLIWQDFNDYPITDTTTEAGLMKAGYVGAFIHNWDYPYKNGADSIAAGLAASHPGAAYIAVDCFKNDAGKYRKYANQPLDRKIFLPATNDEVLASLLYLDWISKFENRKYLQIGEPGVNHEVMPNGAIRVYAVSGDKIMNSGNNIDYTMTINGLDLGDQALNAKSLACGYSGVESSYIETSYAIQRADVRVMPQFNVGPIAAEVQFASDPGKSAYVSGRNEFLADSIIADPASFDAIWDSGFAAFLATGVQAIINERAAKLGD